MAARACTLNGVGPHALEAFQIAGFESIAHENDATRPGGEASRIAVLVSSCESYYKTSLPLLLTTLVRSRIRPCDIFVVIGDAEEAGSAVMSLPQIGEFTAHFITCVNLDNNALLWAVADTRPELAEYEWAFLLHDTTMVQAGFGARLPEVLAVHLEESPDMAALKLCPHLSMSMGYYRLDALRTVRDELLAGACYDNSLESRLLVKVRPDIEDHAFNLIASSGGQIEFIRHGVDTIAVLQSPYGGANRRCEVWNEPGLLKFKANWCVVPMHVDL